MGDTLKSPEDAVSYIRKVFGNQKWPERNQYLGFDLFVGGSDTRYLRHIEEAMYACILSQYPGVQFKRTIEVHEGRTYTISITQTTVGNKFNSRMHDGHY